MMKATAFPWQGRLKPNAESLTSRGPEALFEELALPLLNPLYNFARWLTRNPEEAEDLVQETYLRAYQGFSSFRPGTNFRAWIYRILHNAFRTSRTGLQATMTVFLDAEEKNGHELATTTETPESIVIKIANQDLVRSAIEELPLDFREILLLREVEEMSYREIAAALSLPIGTVMSRLSRARQAIGDTLRKALQPHPRRAEEKNQGE